MSNYQPLSTERKDIAGAKQKYGIWFGGVLGFIFAAFAWGMDGYLLSTMHGLDPWIKFGSGVILCVSVGALAGWLAAKSDKPVLALVIWIVVAMYFAWLTVALPLQTAPRLLNFLEPETRGLLHYSAYEAFASRVGVAFAWIVVLVAINGLLQLPLSEGAVFSTSILGKIAPMLVSLVLMGIAGAIIDGLTNEILRSPVDAMNSTVQYYLDHQGTQVDAAESRKMHQGSLRSISDLISAKRELAVSGFDQYLGEIDILVKFEKAWVECQVFYNQPSNCKQIEILH